MPKPNPKPLSPTGKATLTNLARRASMSKRPQKSESEQAQSSNSKHPHREVSVPYDFLEENEQSDSSSPASTIRPNLGNPAFGNPLPEGGEDPFPRPTEKFVKQTAQLCEWFDDNEFKQGIFEEAEGVPWKNIDLVAHKKLFIHAERRVMTALRENHILRIQGNMPGGDCGVSLQSFADRETLLAERSDKIFKLDEWDLMINDENLGRDPPVQIMQATIPAMAKIHRRIQTQNGILAEETAQWHLFCAWLDDAPARPAYNPPGPPMPQATELDSLRLGSRALLEGACKIIADLEQCVQTWEAEKSKAKVLENETKQRHGTLDKYPLDKYDVKKLYYEPVPMDFTDLWCSTEEEVRRDFADMVDVRGCNDYSRLQKQYRRDRFTQSLAWGAKWIYQVDGQLRELQRLVGERQEALL